MNYQHLKREPFIPRFIFAKVLFQISLIPLPKNNPFHHQHRHEHEITTKKMQRPYKQIPVS